MTTFRLAELQPIEQPLTLFLLGATGNLARRKIIKALYSLYVQDLLPSRFRLVAVARSTLSTTEYAAAMKLEVQPDDDAVWSKFVATFEYVSGDVSNIETFERIKSVHTKMVKKGCCGNHVWYLATLPSLYVDVARFMGQTGLHASECGWTKVLLEKPFGTDFESSVSLNQFLKGVFKEEQIYRIDHFLAKETVQNLLSFRFGNGLFEHLWNSVYIDNIQVQAAEMTGLADRGEFYEGVGTVRDVVQNHVLQLIAMTMMEEPEQLSARAINDRRNKLLQKIRLWPGPVNQVARFGQYGSGVVNDARIDDYVTEAGLPVMESKTETAAAMVFEVATPRWQGVPVFVRAGKRLAQTVTEISIQFREPQNHLFGSIGQTGNVLTLRIQPNEGVVLRLSAKRPGLKLVTEQVPMQFCYTNVFQMGLVEAYVKLLYDAIGGDLTLFPDALGIESAWKVVEPLLVYNRQPEFELEVYAAGSWGPDSFNRMVETMGRKWLEPTVNVCRV